MERAISSFGKLRSVMKRDSNLSCRSFHSRNRKPISIAYGSKAVSHGDGRSLCAGRFRDLYEDLCGDLGGIDQLSEGQRQLVRRASMLSAESERMETLAARGDAGFSIADYGLQVSLLCRVFNILGVRCVARDAATLKDYIAPGKLPVEIDEEAITPPDHDDWDGME
jgi:hypothetical protein